LELIIPMGFGMGWNLLTRSNFKHLHSCHISSWGRIFLTKLIIGIA